MIPFVLEEEVAVVLDVSLLVELVHEAAGSLKSLLLQLCLLLLGIALLIANVIWKCVLMKEEQALIKQGKGAVA
jgi:hypothetical protein